MKTICVNWVVNFRQCKGIFWWCCRMRHHLIKWLFGCSLMQASIRTNIHFISPICNRLHQNSFSTESFFMELFSQNYHSWNNPLYITANGSVLTQLLKADAGAVQSSAGQNRRRVRRALLFDRREINPLKGSENIVNSTGGREVRRNVQRTFKSIWCNGLPKQDVR